MACVSPKMVKKSMYSLYVPKDDGTYIAFSGHSGTIVHINEDAFITELKGILEKKDKEGFLYDCNSEMHKYFYDNEIFVDTDIDEYRLAMYSYQDRVVRDKTLSLILIASRQCNLRCVYCYEDFKNVHMQEIVYENVLKLIENKLVSREFKGVSIELFGGEPFLPFDDLIVFLQKAKDICDKLGAPFAVGATTNFALVSPDRFKQLCEANCLSYQVTIDGLAKTHDKYRPNTNGKGSFSDIINNLMEAKKTSFNFNITIRTNFNDEVLKDAQEFFEFIKESFDDSRFEIYFESIKKLGGKNDGTVDTLGDDEFIVRQERIAKIVSKMGIKNTALDIMTSPFISICYAGKHNYFIIDCDGTVRKCTVVLDDDTNKIGVLGENGDLHIEHSKHSCWLGRETILPEKCSKCKIFTICLGGRCVLTNSINCNPSNRFREIENILKNCVYAATTSVMSCLKISFIANGLHGFTSLGCPCR
ncbi:MAG: radical SAM protein [Defluviitaleaceae bacterium]|nr:radical SAM protein [Defluviitaleaceae bacterium]